MVKVKASDNLKKLLGMRKRAKQTHQFKVVAKLDVRIRRAEKQCKNNKSILEWY